MTNRTKSDQDKKKTGGQIMSDQDISRIVSRLKAAINEGSSGKTASDQDVLNIKKAMGKAKGGKVKPKKMMGGKVAKKRMYGGKVKKSK